MAHFSDTVLIGIVCFLILLCCFFSLAETGMMSLNRYRLRHLVQHENPVARRVQKLIEAPDRLLGLILIGNTFANILASAIFTLLAIRMWGEHSVGLATILLTVVVLILGEIAPKTVAALYPLRVALLLSAPIKILLTIFYPLVWVMSQLTNGLLRMLGVRISKHAHEALNSDELRTLLHEAGAILPSMHKTMLVSLLDLEKLTVDDIMIPKGDIYGIDLSLEVDEIINVIAHSEHLFLPVFYEHIDEVKGVLRMQDIIPRLRYTVTKEEIGALMKPAYFIPESTPLNTQLLNFRHEGQRCGLVVDEYGDVQGLVTIEDILEEIVGEFSSPFIAQSHLMEKQKDGSYIVDAGVNIRDLNRKNNWHFPTTGPKTLSGLIVEILEFIPPVRFCLQIENYRLEVIVVSENLVEKVRIVALQ